MANGVAALHPILETDRAQPLWRSAVWIGQISGPVPDGDVVLAGGQGFAFARLLLWDNGVPRGFVRVPVTDGVVAGAEIATAASALPVPPPRGRVVPRPASVVLCTLDRPNLLRSALASLLRLDHPEFEIVVVDNNPASGRTPPVVAEFPDPRVRLVAAPRRGLSVARNAGLAAARHEIVAYTDDDVVVDPAWLANLTGQFERDSVACVCGMVPTAEIVTPAQAFFDRRVGWASRCETTRFAMSDPPAGEPLFPFQVAHFGTGANFAVRRSVAVALGGFDEGMGVGTPTGGGEDIDMFVRVLLAGHALVYEPSSVVWHRHRVDVADLAVQMRNYGIGLGAWITKLVARPATLMMVLRRLLPGLTHMTRVTRTPTDDLASEFPDFARFSRFERSGIARGPLALLRSRFDGRKARPLAR